MTALRRTVTSRFLIASAALAIVLSLGAEARAIDVANQTDWNTAVAAVAAAGPGSTVTVNLTSGFTLTCSLAPIAASNANVTVNITGNNQTINGNNQFQAIQVSGANAPSVTISDLTITQAQALGGNGGTGHDIGGGGGLGAGAGLFVSSGANVTLQDVAFTGNNAQGGNGGAGGTGATRGGGGGGGGLNGGNGQAGAQNNLSNGIGGSGGNGGSGPLFSGSGGVGGAGATIEVGTGAAGSAGTTGGGGGGGGGSISGTPGRGGNGGFGGGGGGSGLSLVTVEPSGSGGLGAGNAGNLGSPTGNGGSGYGGAVFVMNGATLTIQASTNLNYSGNSTTQGSGGTPPATLGQDIYINGAGQVVTFEVDSGSATFTGSTQTTQGNIAGDGGIIKTGAGTLVLGGTNTYSGGTTVSAGTLTGNTTSVQGNITDNAALVFNQATNGTYSGNISGTGTVSLTGVGNVTFSGANSYNGGTTVSAGTLTGNTTSVQGNITDNASLVFNQATTGTYSGNISGTGAVSLTGAGNVTFSGTNSYGGGTTISAGTLTGSTSSLQGNITDNASLIFNQTTNGTYSGNMSGTGAVALTGSGNVAFTGINTYAGPTTINAGTLIVNGSLLSTTTVNSDGTLGGAGSVGPTTVFGTIVPGAHGSIGALTVNGAYVQNAGSTDQILINDTGQASQIKVMGSATLNGGTVDVLATPGTYTPHMSYTFLTYTGALTGALAGIETDIPFLRAELIYEPGTVDFELLPSQTHFGSIAQTYNQARIGLYLDANSVGATGALANLIDQLSQLSAAGQRAALQMMNGQVNGTLAQLGVQNTTYLYQELRQNMGTGSALSQDPNGSRAGFAFSVPTTAAPDGGIAVASFSPDGAGAGPSSGPCPGPSPGPGAAMNSGETGLACLGALHEPCWSGWTIGYGSAGTAQSDGNASGGSLDAAGAIVAIERALDDQTLLGLFGAYSHLGVSLSGVPQSANADEGRFGFYVRRDWGDALFGFGVGRDYSLVAASAGFTNYDETRQVAVGAMSSTASGDSTGWAPSVYLEQGHRFDFAHWSLCPYAALQYVYLRQNAYTESGADVLDQSVDGSNTDSLRSFLGTSVASRYVTQSGSVLVPQLRAAWVHEFLDTDTTQTASFASLGNGTFAAQGLDFGRDWALVGGGVQWLLSPSVSLFGNYDVQVNTRETLNTGSGGIQFAW